METVVLFYNGTGPAGRQPGIPVHAVEGPDGFTPKWGSAEVAPEFIKVRIKNCRKADIARFIGPYEEWDESGAIPVRKFSLRARYLLRLDQLAAPDFSKLLADEELVLNDQTAFNFLLADRILTAREAYNFGTPLEG